MKFFKKNTMLLPVVLFLSVEANVLRRWLYATGVDETGLLLRGHPWSICLWAVVAMGAVLIAFSLRDARGSNVYEDNFFPSAPGFLGHLVLGYGVLTTALQQLPLEGAVGMLWRILGVLCGAGMIWAGICRFRGQKPFFGIHAGLCLFFLLYLVSRYQVWSANPQLQDYVFELLAMVCLILFSYSCAAFEAGMGNRRLQLATGLLAVLLCGPAMIQAHVPVLYGYGLIWAGTGLCRLDPPPVKDEVETHDPA